MKRLFGAILLCSMLVLLLAACSHTHNFDEQQTTIEASCEEPGLKIQKCRCGDERHSQIPPLGHQYEADEEVVSSCLAEGYITYACIRCNDSYTEPAEQRKYTATELNDMYRNSVGELVVYDKKGKRISLGSCFVYSQDGQLITNYHVIEGGYSAEVTIGYRTYNISMVVAYDKLVDIAILKISVNNLLSEKLQPVKICRQEHMTGETVYALGNSQGLTSTFSKGMITYSDRESEGVHYVQHDAAISSGNSGGPLINEYGEVIGINTMTLEDSQNLNFAIRTSELGHLSFPFSIPMTEFYERERNAYQKVSEHLSENGRYQPDVGNYKLMLDTFNNESHAVEIWAEYAPDKELLNFGLSIDGAFYTVIRVDERCSGRYDWYCFEDYYEVAGIVNANTFRHDTQLPYDYANTPSGDYLESMRATASTAVTFICNRITSSFKTIGITAKDFGFTYFY